LLLGWLVGLFSYVLCVALLVVCLHNGNQISIVNLHLNVSIILLLDHALVGRIIPGSIHALRRGETQLHDEWEFAAYNMCVRNRDGRGWQMRKGTGIERMHSYRINGVPLLTKKKHICCFFFFI